MNLASPEDFSVEGRTLLVRADLNVPLRDGRVSDATRIDRFAVGVRPLLARGARLVIVTHLGRPKGQPDEALSAKQLLPDLSGALECPLSFSSKTVGPEARDTALQLAPGSALLCENLRFDPGEEANDADFANELAKLSEVYINDAFSCSHRAHASIDAITRFLPSVAGPLLLEELQALENALEAPKRPAMAVVGGAKVSTKIAVLRNLVGKLDRVIIGGGMANTFLYEKGMPVGKSLHETDQSEIIAEILKAANISGCEILLPLDIVCAKSFKEGVETETLPASACPEDALILDAGPRSLELYEEKLQLAKTLLWNGPLGAFEVPPFDRATKAFAQSVARRTIEGGLTSVAGGGDTLAALNLAGVADDFTYLSTAGGAFLEWLEGKVLPGIAALERAEKPVK